MKKVSSSTKELLIGRFENTISNTGYVNVTYEEFISKLLDGSRYKNRKDYDYVVENSVNV